MRSLLVLAPVVVSLACRPSAPPVDSPANGSPATEQSNEGEPRGHAHEHGIPEGASGIEIPPPGEGEPQNPLQVEMRALTAFMQLAIVAVANDTLELIPPAISRLHGTIEDTQEALKAGRMTLPKNAEDVEGFLAMDDAFHDQLVALLQAARDDDVARASMQLSALVMGCNTCHARYRFE